LHYQLEKGAGLISRDTSLMAQVYAFRREVESAFAELDRAFDNRENYLPGNLFDPRFENLCDDSRWPAFLNKMGYPH
jgi:hypothetical protein